MTRPYSIPVPNQVLMAMQVIEVMDRIRSPKTGFDKKGTPVQSEARTLTEQEQETYNAALMVVKNYLTQPTEVIPPPRPVQPEPQPQPQVPQPAMTDQELAETLGGYPEEVHHESPTRQLPRPQYNGGPPRTTYYPRPVPRPPGY